MAAQGDLTTLENVKGWLNTGSSAFPGTDDRLLARMITSASRWVENYLSRKIVPANYVEKYNGTGTNQICLRNSPIVSVSALQMDGLTITPSNPAPTGNGYLHDDTTLAMVCFAFTRGFQNVTVSYVAGFQATETIVVPASGGPYKVTGLSRVWNSDRGVSYLVGNTPLTLVTGAPAAGEYKVAAGTDGTFTYTFNVADVAQQVIVTYGYTPADLEQAVIELIGETYKRRGRIGEESKGVGPATVSFSTKVLNENSKSDLDQYKNVVPGFQ